MLSVFSRYDLNQKQLFYALKSSFSLCDDERLRISTAGVYAIFSDKVCVYVGQSKNLPSRIATHLYGKYKNATTIEVYTMVNNGFSNFNEKLLEHKDYILLQNELALIKLYKPIDNIIVDLDAVPNSESVINTIDVFSGDEQDILISINFDDVAISDTTLNEFDVDLIPSLSSNIESQLDIALHVPNMGFFGYRIKEVK